MTRQRNSTEKVCNHERRDLKGHASTRVCKTQPPVTDLAPPGQVKEVRVKNRMNFDGILRGCQQGHVAIVH